MVPQHTVIINISIHDIAKEEMNELINIVNERQVNSIASLLVDGACEFSQHNTSSAGVRAYPEKKWFKTYVRPP